MALNADQVVVAGTGFLRVAPVGTTLPAVNSSPTAAPVAAFIECGYIAEEGAQVKGTPEVTEFKAWQSSTAIRRGRKSQELEINVKLLQWDSRNIILAFGGGNVTTSGGFATYTFPIAGDALPEYAVLLDIKDGTRNSRLVIPRMNGVEPVEAQFNADNMAELPVTLKSLASATAPYWLFDDITAFTAAS